MQEPYFFRELRHGLTKHVGAGCVAAVLACSLAAVAPAQADQNDILIPELGIAGSLGLSLQREQAMGEYFMRTARSQLQILDDPVMQEYANTLGNKLLSHADNVRFPFDFFIVLDPNLNAAAFLGGKVAINTGLFTYARTEDEFASVIAHEISHVTQRHLARYFENIKSFGQVSAAGFLGSLVLAILNPALGMAAVATSAGVGMQARLNFTRENEYEADRIGMDLLYRAGFSPQGMIEMFRQLFSMQGNINPAFTLLIDHPLSDERIAEAVNRAALLPKKKLSSSPDYLYARARVAIRYSQVKDYKDMKQQLSYNSDKHPYYYQQYALALTCYELKQYDEARAHVKNLGASQQNNLFVIDLLSDIDIADHKEQQAIQRLEKLYKKMPQNQVVVLNLGYAYLQKKQFTNAKNLIEQYLRRKPEDLLALNLADKVYNAQRDKCNIYQTRGEILALQGGYSPAIGMYNKALSVCRDHLTRERIRARVGQLVRQRAEDEALVSSL